MSDRRLVRPSETPLLTKLVDGSFLLVVGAVGTLFIVNIVRDERTDPMLLAAAVVGAGRMLLHLLRKARNTEPLDEHDDLDERLDHKYAFRVPVPIDTRPADPRSRER